MQVVEEGEMGQGVRYSCSLTPTLKEAGVITGDRVVFAPVLRADIPSAGRAAGSQGVVKSLVA